jgi:hypothetical protein
MSKKQEYKGYFIYVDEEFYNLIAIEKPNDPFIQHFNSVAEAKEWIDMNANFR